MIPPDPLALARDALAAWPVELRSLMLVHAAPNLVYRIQTTGGAELYLRLTSDARRSADQIAAELELIRYLSGHGFNTPAPLATADGRLPTLRTAAGGVYHAALFPRAAGETPLRWSTNEHNLHLLSLQGRALATLHDLTRRFVPTGPQRFSWRDDRSFLTLHQRLPDFERDVKRQAQAILGFLDSLPAEPDTYGLIHGDFTPGNMLLGERGLAVFDFDDSCYHLYLFDVAVALQPASRLPAELRRQYAAAFLDAYFSIRPLDRPSQDQLSWYHRLVNLTRYYYALRNWDLVNLSPDEVKDLESRRQAVVAADGWS